MSLLLKALQNAAKNREAAGTSRSEAVAGAEPRPPGGELSLEPVQPNARTPGRTQSFSTDEIGDRPGVGPGPQQAQTVLRAGARPERAALREPGFFAFLARRPLVAFSTAAGLFAIGYGTYLYLQITDPGMFIARPSAPPPPPAIASAPGSTLPLPPAVPESPAPVPEPPSPAALNSAAVSGAGVPAPSTGTTAATLATPAPLPPRMAADSGPAAAPTAPAVTRTVPAPAPPRSIAAVPSDPLPTGRADAGVVAAPSSAMPAERPTPTATRPAPNRAVVAAPREPRTEAPVAASGVQVTPVDSNVLAGYRALEKGQLNEAEQMYRQAVASDPRSVDALLGLASTLTQQKRSDAATQFYMRVLELEPRNAHAQAGLLNIGGRADPAAAEARLKQLIAREPSAFLHFTLGNLYAEQGLWAAAQTAFFQAHTMAPDNPDYAFNLAVGLEHLSQPRIALDYYRRAIALAQARGHAQFELARVENRVRSLESALAQRP